MKKSKLKKLLCQRKEFRDCDLCTLSIIAENKVFGRGGCERGIVVFGEAPGPEEDRVGDPFIAKAGKVLDKLFNLADLERNDTFIMNSVGCYPGRNENGGFNKPSEEEMIICSPRAKRTIAIIKPRLIVALGNCALFALTSKVGVGRNRGPGWYIDGDHKCRLFVSYHPSACSRNPEYKEAAKEDWKRIGDWIHGRKKRKCKRRRPTKLC